MAENQTDSSAENAAPETAAQAPQPAPEPTGQTPPKGGYWWGTGRRKSSVARVRIRPGDGKLLINKKQLNDYFNLEQDRRAVVAPLRAVEGAESFDIFVNVRGGGTTGQSGAVSLGIARALRNYDQEYVPVLREGGHLTRDGRMVERKKYGQRKARKRFQFSKR